MPSLLGGLRDMGLGDRGINSKQVEPVDNSGDVPASGVSGAGIGGDSTGRSLGNQISKSKKKADQPQSGSAQANSETDTVAEPKKHPAAPQHRQISSNNSNESEGFGRRFFLKPILKTASFLNAYNGLLTALSTVAVAFLTYFIATDSHRQGSTSNKELTAMQTQSRVMQGQLDAMTDQASITKAQIRANFEMDEITHDPITANGVVTGWWITPHFRNLGATNAVNVKNQFFLFYFQGKPACPAFPLASIEENASVVPPQEDIALPSQTLTYADAVSAAAGEESIFVLGRFQYDDVFSEDRTATVDWCDVLVPNDVTKNQFSLGTIRYDEN